MQAGSRGAKQTFDAIHEMPSVGGRCKLRIREGVIKPRLHPFEVLKGQGPAAPLGEMDFLVDGAMIGGFALVAAPADYGVTGIKTFIVSHSGVVYEKDLGSTTLEQFQAMELYNPDSTWTPVQLP